MTRDELDGCLRLLAAYWPGEWPADRVAVWVDVIGRYPPNDARQAIRQMAKTERTPTVAAYLTAARGPRVQQYQPDPPVAVPPAAVRHALTAARAALTPPPPEDPS
jgi:hypothetical protein